MATSSLDDWISATKEAGRWTRDHWFEISVFIVLVAFVYFGSNDFWFLPENGGGLPIAVVGIGFLFYLWSQKNKRARLLENAIGTAAAEGGEFLDLLRSSSLRQYCPSRDLPFAFVLERAGISIGFQRSRDEIYPGVQSVAGMFDTHDTSEIESLLGSWKHNRLYQELKNLDGIMLGLIPRAIQEQCGKETYFLRLNYLDQFASALVTDREIQLGRCDPGLEPIHELWKQALHLYFKKSPHSGRFPPSTALDFDRLREALGSPHQP